MTASTPPKPSPRATAEAIDAYVSALLAEAPSFGPEQRRRLGYLLGPSGSEEAPGRAA